MLREAKDKREALEAYMEGREVLGVYEGGGWQGGKCARDIKKKLDELFADDAKILIDVDEGDARRTAAGGGETAKGDGEAGGDDGKGKRRVDIGKILALHNAGRTNKWIAEEMRLSPMTVGKYIRKAEERGMVGMSSKHVQEKKGEETGEQE